jgi:hypothetical protein
MTEKIKVGFSDFPYIRLAYFRPDDGVIDACLSCWRRRGGRDGAKLVIDNISLDMVRGSKVDFVEEMISSSFRVSLLNHKEQDDVFVRHRQNESMNESVFRDVAFFACTW